MKTGALQRHRAPLSTSNVRRTIVCDSNHHQLTALCAGVAELRQKTTTNQTDGGTSMAQRAAAQLSHYYYCTLSIDAALIAFR